MFYIQLTAKWNVILLKNSEAIDFLTWPSTDFPAHFLRHIVSAAYLQRLTKCGWVPFADFADLRQRSLAMKWNAKFSQG